MTFDPISYVYVPTLRRSKSTKDLNTTRTNQQFEPGATKLDTERPSVAEDGDGNGYGEFGAEGWFGLESFHGS